MGVPSLDSLLEYVREMEPHSISVYGAPGEDVGALIAAPRGEASGPLQ